MRTIAQNAGFEGSVVVEKVKGMKKGEGLNCANGEYGDMIAMGVSDPVKVTRTALQSAVSVAGLILITECSINEIPKEGPDLSALCWRWRRYGRHDVVFADVARPAGGRLAVQARAWPKDQCVWLSRRFAPPAGLSLFLGVEAGSSFGWALLQST